MSRIRSDELAWFLVLWIVHTCMCIYARSRLLEDFQCTMGGLSGYGLRAVVFSAPEKKKEMSLHTQLSTVLVAANCTRLSVG